MKIIKVEIGKRVFKIKNCKSISSVRGLMFDDLKDKDGALIYANSIWMPFVKRKLNLAFLDKNMKVLGQTIAEPVSFNFKTWKIYKNKNARYCLELKDTKVKIAKGTRIKVL